MGPRVNGSRVAVRAAATPWWSVPGATCIAAYQPKGAADLAASYVNLANPGTYNAAPGVAPTLAAGGWSFNGSTQYLLSPVYLSGSQHSVVVRFSSVGDGDLLFGTFHGGLLVYQCAPNASGIEYRMTNGPSGVTIAPALTAGVIAVIPGSGGYRDGVIDTVIGTVAATSAYTMAIGARNNAGVAQGQITATIAAIAIYSDNPATVAANIVALTTRMQAL